MRREDWLFRLVTLLMFSVGLGCSSELPPAAIGVRSAKSSPKPQVMKPTIVQSEVSSPTMLSPADPSTYDTPQQAAAVPPLPTFMPQPILENAVLPGETVFR
jgi:hypothetical protein